MHEHSCSRIHLSRVDVHVFMIVRMPTAIPTSSDSMRSTTNHPTGY
ncbi:hypothetical protein HMPREF9602_00701 [Cutibacterium acnes HL030PA2]|nr:hypothetical protein HMPREF9574_01029 [Cutibacterium acnes HL074PA1]EFT82378.1 hypothetical protein HMPREF9602_00701 [Cutibacterium acnes HL030PA2]